MKAEVTSGLDLKKWKVGLAVVQQILPCVSEVAKILDTLNEWGRV